MKNHVIPLLVVLMFVLTGCTQSKVEVPGPKPNVEAATPKVSEKLPVLEQDLKGVDDNMKRIVEFLTVNKNVQIATVGADGKPSIRTIWFQFYENGRIYFQTDENSSLYQNLVYTPYIEFVSVNEDNTQTLRVRSEVTFDDNPELIERVLTKYPTIKKYYDSIGYPDLTMFYLKHGSASIFEFSEVKQETTLSYEW